MMLSKHSLEEMESDDTNTHEKTPEYTSLKPFGFESNREKTVSRMDSADELEELIIPLAPGMYKVLTDAEKMDYVIDLRAHTVEDGPRGVCLCLDFQYNAREDGIDCKHILKTKQLIASELLPPIDCNDQYEWMERRGEDYLTMVEEEIETTYSSVLKSDLEDLKETIEDELGSPRFMDLEEIDREFSELAVHS